MSTKEPKTQMGFGDEFDDESWPEFHDDSGFADVHDFSDEDVLIGEVASIREVKVKYGRRTIDTRIMTVRTATSDRAVWESAALTKFFDAAGPGDVVKIQFTGMIPMKGNRNDMKGYKLWLRKREKA